MPRVAFSLLLLATFAPLGSSPLLAVAPKPPVFQSAFQPAFDAQIEVLVEGRVLPRVERDGKTYVVVPRLGVD